MVEQDNEQSVPAIKAMIRNYRTKAKKEWDSIQRNSHPEEKNYQRRYRKDR